ncbi:hypothetical protein K488DRAFT_85913 [Vararia minispora EC-137]|uniref:Uncharacterized protein n=1 Tax=Vararia minispora EC-137 TaxID=1314806 RepID=A0ACB8QKZ5_9AGAM|nr:hypothetical protein K488DRAFT_85913 [Vararia minispora EC-137]
MSSPSSSTETIMLSLSSSTETIMLSLSSSTETPEAEDPVVADFAARLATQPAFIARIDAMSREEVLYLIAVSLVSMKLTTILAFQAIPPSARTNND